MKLKLTSSILLGFAAASFANTPLLVNTDFSILSGDGAAWITSSNTFVNGNWVSWIGDAYSLDDRVDPSGAGFIFTSWDDGQSDRVETYLTQGWNAGPADSPTPSDFQTGDVIVFKGKAMATKAGTDPSDVVARAFIKVLGWNELGWDHQIKPQYSDLLDLGSTLEPFELRVTFPDVTVDTSLQVLDIGFELHTSWDGSAMDTGSIYFEDIEAYIESESVDPTLWAGYTIDENGWVDTGEWMGHLYVAHAPWIYSSADMKWLYMPEEGVGAGGAWNFLLQ